MLPFKRVTLRLIHYFYRNGWK